jgi:hypothetical protein
MNWPAWLGRGCEGQGWADKVRVLGEPRKPLGLSRGIDMMHSYFAMNPLIRDFALAMGQPLIQGHSKAIAP